MLISDSAKSVTWLTGQKEPTNIFSVGSLTRLVDVNDGNTFQKLSKLRKTSTAVRALDLGHHMALERVTLSAPAYGTGFQSIAGDFGAHFRGWRFPTVSLINASQAIARGQFPTIPAEVGISNVDLQSYGALAVRKCIQDVPQFSLFTFITELVRDLPAIPLKAIKEAKTLRNAGGEYLNYQFGIAPTISDLQKLFKALMDPRLRRSLSHFVNEEYRRRSVVEKVSDISSGLVTSPGAGNTLSYSDNKTPEYRTVQDHVIWTSCSFVYTQTTLLQTMLNDLDVKLGGIGVIPNAKDLWNLLPWSWFVDWFFTFNEVIANLSFLGRDGLVMQRGYLMCHSSTATNYRQTGVHMGKPYTTDMTVTYERKYRTNASPFGFGIRMNDFTPFQLSILTALGLSRSRY